MSGMYVNKPLLRALVRYAVVGAAVGQILGTVHELAPSFAKDTLRLGAYAITAIVAVWAARTGWRNGAPELGDLRSSEAKDDSAHNDRPPTV